MDANILHAEVISVEIQADKMDEAIAIYRDSLVPEAHRLDSYRGSYFLVDRESNRAIAFTFWEGSCLVGFLEKRMLAARDVIVKGRAERTEFELAVNDVKRGDLPPGRDDADDRGLRT